MNRAARKRLRNREEGLRAPAKSGPCIPQRCHFESVAPGDVPHPICGLRLPTLDWLRYQRLSRLIRARPSLRFGLSVRYHGH